MSVRPNRSAAPSLPIRRPDARAAVLALVLVLAGLAVAPAGAQIAAPGDVYYKVHVTQKFKYYAFVQDEVLWLDADYEGTSLAESALHDTTLTYGSASVAAEFAADAGTFTADTGAALDVDARTGLFHLMTNTLTVSVYILGPSGTPYWITTSGSGQLDVSRFGGLPGSLQPVNGQSLASFMDSTASVDTTGARFVPVEESSAVSGNTTTQITVGTDTYSLARVFTYQHPARVTQTVCILGCMTEAAHFHAECAGHLQINTYPYVAPTDAPALAGAPALRVEAWPNPLRGDTTVSFRAPAGRRTTVEVFDVAGRRLSALYDAMATGGRQEVPWRAAGEPGGTYFVRVETDGQAATAKLTRVR